MPRPERLDMIRPAYTASEAANLLRISTMSNVSLAGCSILICEDEPLIAIDIADAFSNVVVRVVTVRSPCTGVHCHRRRRSVGRHLGSCAERRREFAALRLPKRAEHPYVLHSGYSPREYNGAADNAASVPKSASPQHLVATALLGSGPEVRTSG